MKKFVIHIVLFSLLPLAGCIAVLLTEPGRKQMWTSSPTDCENRGAFIYQRLFEDTTPVDVAFIGTSHTINGIQDTAIARSMTLWYDSTCHVVNLGYCRFGPEMQYMITRDLLEQKHPNTIVFEVNEKFGAASHPMYPYYARTEDILHPASYSNQAVPANTYNGFLARLTNFRDGLYALPDSGYGVLPSYGYRGYPGAGDSTKLIAPEEGVTYTAGAWRSFQTVYTRQWITATVELCRAENVRVFFLYIPSYHDQPQPLEGMDFYQSLAPLLIITPEYFHDKAYWRDPDHFNDAGAHVFSEEVFKRLCF